MLQYFPLSIYFVIFFLPCSDEDSGCCLVVVVVVMVILATVVVALDAGIVASVATSTMTSLLVITTEEDDDDDDDDSSLGGFCVDSAIFYVNKNTHTHARTRTFPVTFLLKSVCEQKRPRSLALNDVPNFSFVMMFVVVALPPLCWRCCCSFAKIETTIKRPINKQRHCCCFF